MADPEAVAATGRRPELTPLSSRRFRRFFFSDDGLRIIWRLVIFVVLSRALSTVIFKLCKAIGLGRLFEFSRLTPASIGFGHLVIFVATVIATVVMTQIERREFGEYGLPVRKAFQADFWSGGGLGFLAISSSLALTFIFHGFRVAGLAIHGEAVLVSGAYWGIAFVIVGLAEEFSYRGYLQWTLSRGTGFWPAAVLLSAGFALAHARNSGESVVGLLSIVLFGLLFCLFLWRRGNLWLAVGFHAGWDWGETFFYGTPDSGLRPTHNFLTSTFIGPEWLTGGKAGPEASLFTPLVLALIAIITFRVLRKRRYQRLRG